MSKAVVIHGDMLQALPELPENSIDAVVCDPPYHLDSIIKRFGKNGSAPAKFGKDGAFTRASAGFMNAVWDGGDIAFRQETWQEVWEVMKPGGYLIAFSSSRTFGRMQVAIEDAGFVTHPMIGWVFGSGMPKAHRIDVPNTEHLRYGRQTLKPALEPVYMGQKPMEGTGTENWKKWGTGPLDIGASKVGNEVRVATYTSLAPRYGNALGKAGTAEARRGTQGEPQEYVGRWPANIIHDGSDEALAAFPSAPGQIAKARTDGEPQRNSVYGALNHVTANPEPRGDSGSAARFFQCCPFTPEENALRVQYHAKASAKDRAGSEHPTIKPLSLMRYLIGLVTPPGGTVLDPFAGSGTTLQAAVEMGFSAIGVEREAEYVQDIVRRLKTV